MHRVWKQFEKSESIADQLSLWADQKPFGFCFRGDGWGAKNDSTFDAFAGVGEFSKFAGNLTKAPNFVDQANDYVISVLGYDLKNELEALTSNNPSSVEMEQLSLVIPEIIVLQKAKEVHIGIRTEVSSHISHNTIWNEIEVQKPTGLKLTLSTPIYKWTKEQYLAKIRKAKDYIQLGEIYQANICQEVNWTNADIEPAALFNHGFYNNPNPFSVFVRLNDKHILSWSPERFLSFNDRKVISQPMKGTAPRGQSKEEDEKLKKQLSQSEKDRRENVMIVDMVRNDLSLFAEKNSVSVPELYTIDTYPSVHQMHSTVKSTLKKDVPQLEALLKAFPMASMTGAPKIRAMQVIEELESSSRGVFSGSIGYFTPSKQADFNVVIRTLVYEKSKQFLSAHVGGGITAMSDEENEFDECLTKLKPIQNLLYEFEK